MKRRERLKSLTALCAAAAAVLLLASCTTTLSHADAAVLLYNIGNHYYRAGAYDTAGMWYEDALSHAPDDAVVSYNTALSAMRSGTYERAAELLLGLLARDPDNIAVREALALNSYLSGSYGDALAQYESLLSDYGAVEEYQHAIVKMALEMDDRKRAEAMLAQLLDTDSPAAESCYLQGEFTAAFRADKNSWEWYALALQKDPGYDRARSALLASIEKAEGQELSDIGALVDALSLADGDIFFALGIGLLGTGDDTGFAYLTEAVRAGFADEFQQVRQAVAALPAELRARALESLL